MALLKDDTVIGPDDFVEIDYPDGDRAAIRKRDISGIFYERDGTQQGVIFMPEGVKLRGDTGATTDQGDTRKTDQGRHPAN